MIDFKTEDGITLRGWHYLPDNRSGKVPTIVMAHGFSAVKEMYLDRFAEAFANVGLGSTSLRILGPHSFHSHVRSTDTINKLEAANRGGI
jgi:cephalosporin-C deacetylase-like acetyl esterase